MRIRCSGSENPRLYSHRVVRILNAGRCSHYESIEFSLPGAVLTTGAIDRHYRALFSLPEHCLLTTTALNSHYHSIEFSLPEQRILTTDPKAKMETGCVHTELAKILALTFPPFLRGSSERSMGVPLASFGADLSARNIFKRHLFPPLSRMKIVSRKGMARARRPSAVRAARACVRGGVGMGVKLHRFQRIFQISK